MQNTITLLVKNIQFFTYEVQPDRIDEIGNCQDVIDLDFDLSDKSVKQITTDYYEFDEVLKEL